VELALNNRELVVLIWLGIGLVFVLVNSGTRQALWRVVVAFRHPVLLVSIAALVAYVAVLVWMAAQVGIWKDDVFNDTVIWFLTAGLVLWANTNRVAEQSHFIRRTFTQAVAVTVFIEGFVNLYVFALPIEFFFFTSLLFITLVAAVAESDEQFAAVAKLANGLLAAIGLVLIAFVLVELATGFGSVDWPHVGRLVFLPVWLTIGVLPAIYALRLYAAYDSAFRRIGFFAEKAGQGKRARRRAKLALLVETHMRARAIGDFSGLAARRLVLASSFKEAREIVAAEIAGQREEDAFLEAMDEAA
jgi:hypothetical protein